VIPCGFESFSLDSSVQRLFLFEQVEGDAVEQREVLCRVSSAFSVQVFAEAHVEDPVQFVFNAPMLANYRI